MTEIRKTKKCDLDMLLPILDEARATIATLGIDQWQNGYPNREVISEDIKKSQSYCVSVDGEICGTFALINNGEPTYNKIFEGEWLTDNGIGDYFAIHRVAISVKCRGKGLSTAIINHCAEEAKKAHKKSLRIDTHKGNIVMRKMLEKHGFIHCGTIYLENGDERVAYERIV